MEYECGIKLFLMVIFVSLLLSNNDNDNDNVFILHNQKTINIGLRLIVCIRLRIALIKSHVNVYESIILLITINFIFCTLQPHVVLWRFIIV